MATRSEEAARARKVPPVKQIREIRKEDNENQNITFSLIFNTCIVLPERTRGEASEPGKPESVPRSERDAVRTFGSDENMVGAFGSEEGRSLRFPGSGFRV